MYILRSYAKLNLILHLYPPLASGYHPIQSVFQSISLHDVLHIKLLENKEICLTSSDPTLPVDGSNILSRLYQKLAPNLSFGLEIHVEKNIPVGGGLGGGSSNAGSLLTFLLMMSSSLTPEMIYDTARALGSDVPFFLTGGRALVSGTGEIIKPLPPITQHYVLLHPGLSISSADLYQSFDVLTPSLRKPRSDDDFLASAGIGENDFQLVVWEKYPIYLELSTRFNSFGYPPLFLSGSGATAFMIADSQEEAHRLAAEVKELYPSFWVSVESSRAHA